MSAPGSTRPHAQDDQERIWYACSCHCGATLFKVLHESIEPSSSNQHPVTACNCSICVKSGYHLIYVLRKDIQFIKGWEDLKNYRFASKTRDHKFCGICGTSIGIDFLGQHKLGDALGINVRVIEGIDIQEMRMADINGREYQPEFNNKSPRAW
ncbi:Mss4-like protein [Trichoderma novae-zelandiae]